jgi:hypothetical protein
MRLLISDANVLIDLDTARVPAQGRHPRSLEKAELWSPGSPVFPTPDEAASADDLQGVELKAVLAQGH